MTGAIGGARAVAQLADQILGGVRELVHRAEARPTPSCP